ncbi:glutathione S-transferase family protein [Pleionea sp. CnH1-48]|uniref:glutathione S-transferase family protein n=1 Tax=Pleionea sp. CnH1-48 TaxID=2954494 RepID=UPI002097625A|nr:glutathione S-transferase family protein [Pleionea sp. CnH1-48]MCO7224680.1 glutathione S-transferase [Pleionea sp. CnH1-48]
MKLFYSTASPYARATRIMLREASLDFSNIEYSSHPFDNEPDFLQTNPLGKVPCLLLESGESLYDSEVICQYLDSEHNEGKLWAPVKDNWQARKTYSLVSGLLDTSVALQQEKMRAAEALESLFWKERFIAALERGAKELSRLLPLYGEMWSLLSINSLCLLDYLSFRHPELDWKQHSPLLEHYKLHSIRDSFEQTAPK